MCPEWEVDGGVKNLMGQDEVVQHAQACRSAAQLPRGKKPY